MQQENQKDSKQKVGAALVVGGGIGGMEAALDLADSGIKVYLLESKPAIGGVMAQLDKTFPTNDCAMCSMAPRLVAIGRHKDIQIITLADLEKIEGRPGNFKVALKKKAGYVNEEKCTGCGECSSVCPIEFFDEYNLNLVKTKAIYRLYPQAVPGAFTINKLGQAPCRFACPVGQRAEGYIALIGQKKYAEAYRLIRRDNPFPSICGRVCVHPCEQACSRGLYDEAVAIRQLKRFVTDWAYSNNFDSGITESFEQKYPEKVAVIGSGPAGLTCAYDLAKKGYPVKVFEAEDRIGGMAALSIPDFRLPKNVLEREIGLIKKAGVEIRTNTSIQDIRELKKEYSAVCLAIGCPKSQRLNIPGENLRGVIPGLDFLKEVKLGNKPEVGERVVIIGGGNVAMDASRTALRLGAKEVAIIYRRSSEEMPASMEEIEEAEKEGIKIQYLTAPFQILEKEGKVKGIRCQRMELGLPDETGRKRPLPIPGSEFEINTDTVIPAIGQLPDTAFLKDIVSLTKQGTIVVNADTLETSKAGIFAIGDVVSGPATIVEAIAAGHKAANLIDQYLRGENLTGEKEQFSKVELSDAEIKKRIRSREKRQKPAHLIVAESKTGFAERQGSFTEEQAIIEANRCLECGPCSECLMCEEVCKVGAIEHQMPKEKKIELNVGAIVLSSGSGVFDPALKIEYGYGRYPNVISALQLERILSASGPYSGKVLRPSDKKVPKKVAFIQCVGSRDTENKYCSSVCCMYATKQAIIAKEHQPNMYLTIFFTDVRAFSKGFEDYHRRARELGVKYIRCRPSSIKEIPATQDLKIKYQTERGEIQEGIFDLAVLSTGLQPNPDTKALAEKLGIQLNEHNFCWTEPFEPARSSKVGIYTCGTFTEPRDIPETVMQASAAASQVLELLCDVRGSLIQSKEYPPERDVSAAEARIGVFVCHCGKNIGGIINVPEVREYSKSLPGVVYAEDNLYTCSTDTAKQIKEIVAKEGINRLVVAACSPRTHEVLFQETLKESGLNPYLLEMTNIRDQCSWPHMYEPEKATKKAKDLVRMAVAKARLLEPLYAQKMKINKSVLIVGGGLAGMTAALSLAARGIKVHLVEKEKELGGNLRKLYFELKGGDPQKKLYQLVNDIYQNSNIRVYTEAKVVESSGSVGKFKSRILSNGKQEDIEHGTIVVATGAEEHKPQGEYLYGADERIMTQLELEGKLSTAGQGFLNINTAVMIQCVGARNEAHPYCNRVCCAHAIKNALKLKEINPQAKIYILYRDIRTYGFYEPFYRKAREKGVLFIRYEEDSPPLVSRDNGRLNVEVKDALLGKKLIIDSDYVVLSTGPVPAQGNEEICKLLKIPLSKDEFFLEKHIKLCPCECATPGIFISGLAHYPKFCDETISSAEAAVSMAYKIVGKDEKELEARTSFVVEANCDGCAYCVDPCPNDAITLIEYAYDGAIKKTVEINTALCEGCGVCMATCPKKGIYVKNFRADQIMAMVDAALGQ